MKQLQPIELIEFGEIQQIFGWSFVAGTLPIHVIPFLYCTLIAGLYSIHFGLDGR